ncbi:MAG TPA: DnaJ domain-containing protein [Sandaracinaceae bacterium LLY-WYZ-13_1]|nr:DnaJ domain-containing protein [Sandaracinaceae bacterium LLY-WYZ-13_1]
MDLTGLPLSPLEGFVVSRIDGAASVAVLADLTNLEESQVETIVDKLIELGAVEWARESVSLPRATGRPATRTPSRAVSVPPSLQRPPSPRSSGSHAAVRMRTSGGARSASPSEYRGEEKREERVDLERRSQYPSAPPRASHTGSIVPPGELEEVEEPEAEAPPAEDPPGGSTAESTAEPAAGSVGDAEGLATADTMRPPPSENVPGTESVDTSALAAEAESLLEAATSLLRESSSGSYPAVEAEEDGDGDGASEPHGAAASEPAPEAPEEAGPAEGAPARLVPEPDDGDPTEAGEPAQLIVEPDQDTAEPEEAAPAEDEPPEEELDLPPERRKRVDDLYYALDLLDHYQVLGIERGVERKEIRSAYFRLSKIFHPDTMFRKRLGPYKSRMEAIFQRLTEAYEVLGRKRSRQDYDRYLTSQDRTRAVEAVMEAPEEMSEAEERELRGQQAAQAEAVLAAGGDPTEAGTEPAAEEKQPPAASADRGPRSSMSEAGRRRARQLMADKLRRAARASSSSRTSSTPSPAPSSPAPAEPVRRDRRQVLRELTGSLRDTADHTGGLDQMKRLEASAERAEKAGDLAEAAHALRLALVVAPERTDLKERHAQINAELSASLSTAYEEQARYEQRHGKWAAAAISWGKVVEGRPDDARAARFAAEALVKAEGDLHRARELAQKAADLAPEDVENLRALGRVYIAAGLPLNARRVLQRAAALDPSDEMVENLLRGLDGA